ncbi:MAG: hypothetical protein GY874_15050 [Desulfobacteraceae bacterium]|nr:hypothetical protein [Desulfobacteraceae bacterium]
MAIFSVAENRLESLQYTDGDGVIHKLALTYYYNDFLARIQVFANNVQISDLRIVRNGFLAA